MNLPNMKLPDGWNDYSRIGKRINGTRFLAFKVPLRQDVNTSHQIEEDKQLYPKLLLSLVPDLGMVIDLTNTTKYYNAKDILQLGISYEKINVEGQKIPNKNCSIRFRDAVNKFLDENAENEKLIGVHCTHGLNRTGFIIGRYMIEDMHIPPLQAIAAFEVARGHQIERKNYTDFLKTLKYEVVESLAIDTETNKGTQTQNGYWLTEASVRPRRKQSSSQHRKHSPNSNNIVSNDADQQVALVGCVNISNANLIPDGRGGFFVHIQKKDILPNNRIFSNSKRRLPQTPTQNRHAPFPDGPPRRQNDWSSRNNKFQRSNNSVTEDLLRMEFNDRQRMFRPPPFPRDMYGQRDGRQF